MTHFIGVPLVVLSLLIALGWVRIGLPFSGTFGPSYDLSLAMVFMALVTIWYLKVDLKLALVQFPFSLVLLVLGDFIATLPWSLSLTTFVGVFVLGWFFQLLGHYIEGNRPALRDNFLQIFNAPLFLAAEMLFALGFYQGLRNRIKSH
jgi:uncharacterized membrane protein YGL010W